MNISDAAITVDNTVQRHPPEFKEVYFLPVLFCDGMLRIRQPDIWDAFLLPIAFEGFASIWTDSHDLGTAGFEILIVITHARQLRAAMRSHKSAQECEDNRLIAAKT